MDQVHGSDVSSKKAIFIAFQSQKTCWDSIFFDVPKVPYLYSSVTHLWWIKSMDQTPTQSQNVSKTLYIVMLFGPSIWHEVGKSYIFCTPESQKTGWDWDMESQRCHIYDLAWPMGGSQPIHGPKNAQKGIDFKHFLWWIKSMDLTWAQKKQYL